MGGLSANFDKSEFACRCGCGQARMDSALVEQLQNIRNVVGRPVRVSSGFRCVRHNAAVGGEDGSQHTHGRAADIVIKGISPRSVAWIAKALGGFGGIIAYPEGWTHLDVRPGRVHEEGF